MQRHKKIELYLSRHPYATERDLRRKFDLSRDEAKRFLNPGVPEPQTARVSFFGWNIIEGWLKDEKQALLILVGAALLVRCVYAFFLFREPLLLTPLHDAEYYLSWGRDILSGGYLGNKIFFTEPFYAYFLSLFLALSQTFAEKIAILFQFGLGSLLPVLLYGIAKKLFNRSAGLWTGLLAALYGPLLFYEGLLLKTSLEIFSLSVCLLLILIAFERRTPRMFLATGLVLGVTVLIKGNSIVYVPVVIGLLFWLWHKEASLKQKLFLSGAFLLGFVAVISPVTLRNSIVGHDFVLTNYSSGLALYQGNWWGSDGSTAQVPSFLRPSPRYEEEDAVGMAEAYAGRSLKPSEVSSFWTGKAMREAVAQPGHFLANVWEKLLLIFNHSEFSDNYSYHFYRTNIPFLWALPNFWTIAWLGLGGLALLFRKSFWKYIREHGGRGEGEGLGKSHKVFLLLFFGYVGVLLLTTVNARYRMPLLPFLLVFAGGMLSYLISCWRDDEWSELPFLSILAVLFLLVTGFPLKPLAHESDANAYHPLGYAALEKGDYPLAREYFNKTLEIDSQYGWAYGNLVLVNLLEGRLADAKETLKKSIALHPDDLGNYRKLKLIRSLEGASPEVMKKQTGRFMEEDQKEVYDPNLYEGQRMLSLGDEASAEKYFQNSIAAVEDPQAALLALASLKRKQGNALEASMHLRRVVADHPEIFIARYNLANIAINNNDFSEVVNLLKDIYDFTPELGETWYNYAVALVKTGKNQEAASVMQAYVDRYKNDPSKKEKVEKFQGALKPASPDIQNLLNKNKGQ